MAFAGFTLARIKRLFRSPLSAWRYYGRLYGKAGVRWAWLEALRLPVVDGVRFAVPRQRISALRQATMGHFFFSSLDRARIVTIISGYQESMAQKVVSDAQAICQHEFSVLGSGRRRVGKRIPWRSDWKNGKVWPISFWSSFAPLSYSGRGELKVPWELSRFYHAVTLGQAYWLTNEEYYAVEFVDQVRDWETENPVYRSCNWANAMEVSIRLANLLMAWMFFLDSPSLTDDFHCRFLRLCWRHGLFVMHNLEDGPVRTNHYLADLLGVIYFGVLFPTVPMARRWLMFCLQEFEKEIRHQFYDDGTNFESSISYHRLSTEIALLIILLCRKNDIPLGLETLRRIEQSCLFTRWYTKPNGLAPQIGDNDDGRIHRFDGVLDEEMRDHRHLLSLASCCFPDRKEFQSYRSSSIGTCWLCPLTKTQDYGLSLPPLSSTAFSRIGMVIMRSGEDYCIVDVGGGGQDGNGGHSHNDTLSFELHLGGEDIFVDPGTYVYTEDPTMRNHFRSTAMHNAVMVDTQEISPIVCELLFSLPDRANPRIIVWRSTGEEDELIAEHSGYKRLPDGLVHRRRFRWQKKQRQLLIDDQFVGDGIHQFDWFFHCAVGITLQKEQDSVIIATPYGQRYIMMFSERSSFQVNEGWISQSYGIRSNAPVLQFRCVALASQTKYRFIIAPVCS